MKGAVHVVGRRGPKWISLNRSLWWWWRGTHGIIGSGHMGTPSLGADRQTDRTENVSFPQTTCAGNNKTKHIETSTIVLKESGNMLKIVAAEFTKTHRIHFSRMLLSWNYYQLIIINLEFKEETWRMHFVSDVVNVFVSLRLRVQNRRKKWNFPPNFRNGIIWTAPSPLNIRNGIIWGGAFSKAFRSSEALISVLSKNAHLCFRSSEALISVLSKMPACALGLQKHLFRYSLKMPACALGLQKHLFRYSLKMPTCALGLQKHLFRYSLKCPPVW